MGTTAIQTRGGTTTEHVAFIGLEREVTVDTTKHTLVVHDGITAGGFPLAKASDIVSYTKPVNEPISYITGLQTALDGKTTTTYVDNKIAAVVGVAPAALDTLSEIAIQLANDNNAIGALTTTISNKVDKVIGKQLSTEDYTTADKTKLDGLSNYTLPTASSSVSGGVKVSATAQTVAANAVTTTASKTYAVQLDASGNALVNVPWSDTNTVYTHPTSGVIAGTYSKITVDNNGHITAGTNPTTLAGFGIADAYTKTDIDLLIGDINSALDTINGQVI